MSMTLDEMKLAMCEKLQKCVDIHKISKEERGDPKQGDLYLYYWNNEPNRQLINWPTEGLQVCHEAEKLLTAKEKSTYMCWFWEHDEIFKNRFAQLTATYEQRLEALCRVWFPERFL